MTLQESLQSLVDENKNVTQLLSDKVGEIPQLIKDAKEKAVADYIAANPPVDPGGGPVTIDGVTYDSLIEAMQAIMADQKTIRVNADIIPEYFESERVHGNPWWPNDPPAVES